MTNGDKIFIVIYPQYGDMTPVEVYTSKKEMIDASDLGYLFVEKEYKDNKWIDVYQSHVWEKTK